MDGLAEGLLRSARPIGNAVKGQAHAPRCTNRTEPARLSVERAVR